MRWPAWTTELVRYGLCGVLAAGTDFGVYALLVHAAGLPPLVANLISRPLGGVVSFLGNRQWTFRTRALGGALGGQARRYAAVWLVAYGLSELFLWIHQFWLADRPMVAKAFAEGGAALVSFLLNRHWTFR